MFTVPIITGLVQYVIVSVVHTERNHSPNIVAFGCAIGDMSPQDKRSATPNK